MKEQYAQLSKEQAQQVCKNIATLANSLAITHDAIAMKIGLERPSVTRILSGKNSPRLDLVYSLLAAINELSGHSYSLNDVDALTKK